MPRDVASLVIGLLPAGRASSTFNQVSSHWASNLRLGSHSLLIQASWSSIRSKIATLFFFRERGSFCGTLVTIQLTSPLDAPHCSVMLKDLQHQVTSYGIHGQH